MSNDKSCGNCGHLPGGRDATHKCINCAADYCETCYIEMSLDEDGNDNGGCFDCGNPTNEKQ